MTDERLEECRRWLTFTRETHPDGARLAVALELLAEVDRLRADVAGYAALADALEEHGVAGGVVAWAVAREREECVRLVCHRCAAGEMSYLDCDSQRWWHRGRQACLATAIRSRGPLAPPLPAERLAARVAALEAALRPFADAQMTEGADDSTLIRLIRAGEIRAARKALEDSP